MTDVAIGLVAVLAWAAVLYKARSLRGSSDSARALWAALAFLAVGLTVFNSGVYRAIDGFVGRPNLAQLLKDSSVIASASATQILLLLLSRGRGDNGPRIRTRATVALVAVCFMATFFLLAPAGTEDPHYASKHDADTDLIEYRLGYLAYLTFAFADIVRLCTRFARLCGDALLSLGLRLVVIGGAAGIGYTVLDAASILAARLGDAGAATSLNSGSKGFIPIASLLVIGGSTMPAWGRRVGLTDRANGLQARRRLKQLKPLWIDLTAAVPEVVLDEPGRKRRGRDANEELYRTVIEIEDVRLAVRDYEKPDAENAATAVATAQGRQGEQLAAAIQGARLATSLSNYQSGTAERLAVMPSLRDDGVADVDAEAKRLGLVAEAFFDREFIDDVVAKMSDGRSTPAQEVGNVVDH